MMSVVAVEDVGNGGKRLVFVGTANVFVGLCLPRVCISLICGAKGNCLVVEFT